MNVLITGGCGFIGWNLCNYLRTSYDIENVYCLDVNKRSDCKDWPLKVEYVNIDVFKLNSSELDDYFANVKIDVIVHLASKSLPETTDIFNDAQQNLMGTLNLLEFAKRKNVKKFIFMSSGGTVYGDNRSEVIDEKQLLNPICSYGATKVAIETYLRIYKRQYGINTLSLRLANPYGPYQNPFAKQGLIAIFCKKALMNEGIQIFGDGKIERDYIYIDDVCQAIKHAIFADYDFSQTELNIGSGVGHSINEIVYSISSVLKKELKVSYVAGRSFDVQRSVLDNSRATLILDWEPTMKLTDGIEKTIHYLKYILPLK